MNPIDAMQVLERLVANDPTVRDPGEVAAMIRVLAGHWLSTQPGLSMKGVQGAPDWMGFESRIWELGETLRSFLRARRWRGRNVVLDAAAEVAANPRYGKGRQSFALLLGELGGGEYAEVFGPLLADDVVKGHVVKALLRAKIGSFEELVRPMTEHKTSWIRQAAKKYIAGSGTWKDQRQPS